MCIVHTENRSKFCHRIPSQLFLEYFLSICHEIDNNVTYHEPYYIRIKISLAGSCNMVIFWNLWQIPLLFVSPKDLEDLKTDPNRSTFDHVVSKSGYSWKEISSAWTNFSKPVDEALSVERKTSQSLRVAFKADSRSQRIVWECNMRRQVPVHHSPYIILGYEQIRLRNR